MNDHKNLRDGSGLKVETFTSPLTALENFKTGLYDLAIIDTRMPYMSGFEVYRRFKELDKKSKSVLFGTR